MKKNNLVQCLFLSLLSLFSLASLADDLVIKNGKLSQLTDWVSTYNGETYLIQNDLNLIINLNIKNIQTLPPKSVLNAVLVAHQLKLKRVSNINIITKADDNTVSSNVSELRILPTQLNGEIDISASSHTSQSAPVKVYKASDFITSSYKVLPQNIDDIFNSVQNLISINTQLLSSSSENPLTLSAAIALNSSQLVVIAPKDVQSQVKSLVKKLNILPRQILVEALIYETTNLNQESIGMSLKLANLSKGLKLDLGSSLGAFSNGASIFYNPSTSINSLFTAVSSDDQNNVLSNPKLRIIDSKSGEMNVGQVIPFITSQRQNNDGTTTNVIQRINVGLSMKVTPKVYEDKIISDILITTGSVSTDSNAVDLITNNRSINTSIITKSGSIVHLAGLMTHSITDTKKGVPVLQDVPIIGAAFRTKTKKKNKVTLSIFLKTTLIDI